MICKSFVDSRLFTRKESFASPPRQETHEVPLIFHTKSGNLQAILDIFATFSNPQVDSLKQKLLSDVINATDELKWSAIHHACHLRYPAILKALLEHHTDVNTETIDHYIPLQLACFEDSYECVELLLSSPLIQINKMTTRGSALHIACKNGNKPIVEKLLQSGAHPALEDSQNNTPILLTNSIDIIELIPKYIGLDLIQKYTKGKELPLSFSGMVYWSSPYKINESEVFLVLNSSTGLLQHYNRRSDFENNFIPAHIILIKDVQDVRTQVETIISSKYFIILKTKMECFSYYTQYVDMTSVWTQRILDAVNYYHVSDGKGPARIQSYSQDFREVEESCSCEANSQPVTFESFQILREVGTGSFGKVYEAVKKDTKARYALKVLGKFNLNRQNQLKYAIAECKILKEIRHPFIIPLHWAFQTHKNLYMVYEFCPYGDLSIHLKNRKFLTEPEAKLYISETLLAVEYLHSLNIVYRDLKPLNILLDSLGHVKLADFGLAKANVSQANPAMSFCGSPGYLAPELVKHTGGHKPVDIYAIGVTLYELLTGRLPFQNENIASLYKAIASGKVKFPEATSHNARALIKWMMQTDPNKRPTVQQAKMHEFFEGVDWEGLMHVHLPSPFRPHKEYTTGIEEIKEILEESKEITQIFEVTMIHE